MKLKSIQLIVLASLVVGCTAFGAIPTADAQGNNDRLTEWIRGARESEARGNYNDAGGQYYSLLQNEFNLPMPQGVKIAVGRRAVACLTIAARQGMTDQNGYEGWAHVEALNTLEQTWRAMQKLEPNNPTWSYLMATRECSQGRYADARNHLQFCMRTTGGQPSVRRKAQALLTHINKFATIDQQRMTNADKAAMQALLSGRFMTNTSNSDSTSSGSSESSDYGSSVSDSERRARNAENAGDSGAAARFRSGGTTVQDHSKYW